MKSVNSVGYRVIGHDVAQHRPHDDLRRRAGDPLKPSKPRNLVVIEFERQNRCGLGGSISHSDLNR